MLRNTLSHNEFHILFPSRLVYEKGADILLAAIESSLTRWVSPKKIVWHILSAGPYLHAIVLLTKQYPDSVFYHGSVSPEEIAGFYRKSDLLFMPSRFLETFGLTALEALSSGTPVCGFQKWWLTPFISTPLALSEEEPIESFLQILERITPQEKFLESAIAKYSQKIWRENLSSIITRDSSILIMHDYTQLIWWAEYYVENLIQVLEKRDSPVARYSYSWNTNTWKRRWMFVFSFFAFWRAFSLRKILHLHQPEIIWMHSVLRYIWYWWVREVYSYSQRTWAKVYLSHHDLWFISAFPQDITDESQIPSDASLSRFIAWVSGKKKILAMGKWWYIRLIRRVLPGNTEHIIFAPFLEPHIHRHFPDHIVWVFPHSVDESIFHP